MDIDLGQLLRSTWSTSPMSFKDLCNTLRHDIPDKPEPGEPREEWNAFWRGLFGLIEEAEADGLMEVSRKGRDMDTLQLTPAGADRIRGQLDRGRGLLNFAEDE